MSFDMDDFEVRKERVFLHTLHRKLWDWLSKHPGHMKNDWPEWANIPIGINSLCFACEYNDERECSEYCPLVWPTEELEGGQGYITLCSSHGGMLFTRWKSALEAYLVHRDSARKDLVIQLAEEIRDLPVRKGILCK